MKGLPMRSARLTPTLVACVAALAALLAALNALTLGFEHWTFESLRRESARQGRLAAPAVAVRTAVGEDGVVLWKGAGDSRDVYLVSFIYTRCPSVCQALGSEFAQMQAALRELRQSASKDPGAPAVRLVSLSFDPEHDGRRELARYAKEHRVDPAFWTVAAPEDAHCNEALLTELGVIVIPDGFGGYAHNGAIHLVDASGSVRAIFDDDQWPQALAAATRLSERMQGDDR
jgi:protein SCO1/2